MENIKRKQGAPRKSVEDRKITAGLKLTPAQKLIYMQVGGGAWVRSLLDQIIRERAHFKYQEARAKHFRETGEYLP